MAPTFLLALVFPTLVFLGRPRLWAMAMWTFSDWSDFPSNSHFGQLSLLAVLAPKAVEVEVYKALLENQTGEHAARMAAMESATRNTEELVDTLTLQFNRARQAAITRELVEIVSGAEAL